jgi:gliding motility-associated-like protein
MIFCRIFFCIFCFSIFYPLSAFTFDNGKGKQLTKQKPVEFIENKGQMTNSKGEPVPSVLFKAETSTINFYITEKGLTYVFLKHEKNEPQYRSSNNHFIGRLISFLKNEKESEEKESFARWEAVEMELKGANINKGNIIKEYPSQNFSQYFYAHCPNGITYVHSFKKITIKNIYPGIDWILYNSSENGFKYDFVLHPGADPYQIKMVFSSLNKLSLNNDNSLSVKTDLGLLHEERPYSYLKENKREINSYFKIRSQKKVYDYYQTTVGFDFSEPSLLKENTIVIDPQLTWATFFAGTDGDTPNAIQCDSSGNVFIESRIARNYLPVTDPGNGAYYQGTMADTLSDIEISKFTNAGVLQWSTYYGGSDYEFSGGITIDKFQNVFVVGSTFSTDFPTQDPGGNCYFQGASGGGLNAFVIKFTNSGQRLWATYLGGSDGSTAYAVTSDTASNLYVVGGASSGFPVQPLAGAYNQATSSVGGQSMFLSKFSSTGNLVWSTFYGGSGDNFATSVDIDKSGNILVAGTTTSTDLPLQNLTGAYNQSSNAGSHDAFIMRLLNTGALNWATYMGGSQDDWGYSVETDDNNNIVVVGNTSSSNFPVIDAGSGAFYQGNNANTNGYSNLFISKFNASCAQTWSTYYGGNATFVGESFSSYNDALVIDPCGNILLTFFASTDGLSCLNPQNNFYFHPNAYVGNGDWDGMILYFNTSGVLKWGTYFGGGIADDIQAIALDKENNLFMAGEWNGYEWSNSSPLPPLTNPNNGAYYLDIPAYGQAGFVAKFTSAPLNVISTVQNANCNCNGVIQIDSVAGSIGVCSYIWSNDSTGQALTQLCAGTILLKVRDEFCQTGTQNFTITANGGFDVDSIITSTSCENTFDGAATITPIGGVPPYTYVWAPAGGNAATATNLQTGTYTVTVTDSTNCTLSKTITVPSQHVLMLNPVIAPNTSCTPNGSILLVPSGGNPPYIYLWNSDQTIDSITNLSPGKYFVTVSDANGCAKYDSVIVPGKEVPEAAVTATPSTISLNQSSQLHASGGVSFTWLPATGLSCTACPDPIVFPTQETSYCVIAADSNSCLDTACVTIKVEALCDDIIVPTAFSPNNDGKNDVFKIQGLDNCFSQFELMLFDRWGEKVFESNAISNSWNGMFKGRLLDAGVFVYTINASLIDGTKLSKKGNISLIR